MKSLLRIASPLSLSLEESTFSLALLLNHSKRQRPHTKEPNEHSASFKALQSVAQKFAYSMSKEANGSCARASRHFLN